MSKRKNDDTTIQLHVREFNMKSIKPSSKILLVGRSGVGKTTIVKDICRQLNNIPLGICMTGTEDGVEDYSKIIPPLFVYNKYYPKALRNLIAIQKKKNKKIPKGSPKRQRAFVLMDDLHYDKSMLNDKQLDYIAFNSRHDEIDAIWTAQDPTGFKPRHRTNLNYIFILNDSNFLNREKLFKYYAGQLGSISFFNQVMDAFTSNYSCLVIDNTSTTNKLEDSIYWYRSPNLPINFKMCSKDAWEFSKNHYRENDEYKIDFLEPKKKKKKV